MQGIYFIDFECVPQSQYLPLKGEVKEFFLKRFRLQYDAGETIDNLWNNNAGLYAEYCKIISVSIGTLVKENFYVKTITGRVELEILAKLSDALKSAKTLCGHNLFEYDGPVGMRRYLINDLPVPAILNMMNKKPWDIPYFDTMKMWSGSAWNHKISQDQLAHLLGVQSSKGDLDGSKIAELYYSMFDGVSDTELPFEKENEVLARISKYNAEDVICNARIFAKMRGEKPITDQMIIFT